MVEILKGGGVQLEYIPRYSLFINVITMQLQRHLVVECTESEVPCQFKPYGCSVIVSIHNLALFPASQAQRWYPCNCKRHHFESWGGPGTQSMIAMEPWLFGLNGTEPWPDM